MRPLVFLPTLYSIAAMQCSKSFPSPQATFDLSALTKKNGGWYNTTDVFFRSTESSRPFTYFFNVCANTTAPSSLCKADGSSPGAWQIVNSTQYNSSECYPLGMVDDGDVEWTYISGDNAAVGVGLTYTDGGDCRDAPGKRRSFTIEFSCVHELSALPPVSAVREDSFCQYKVTVESIWGCPTECHSADHSGVCGGHGICAVDTGTKRSRCFCNLGKGGPDCTKDVPVETTGSSSKATSILVTIVLLLLMALFGLAGVLYVKIKKLNSDDNPYGAFDDQGNAKSTSDGL